VLGRAEFSLARAERFFPAILDFGFLVTNESVGGEAAYCVRTHAWPQSQNARAYLFHALTLYGKVVSSILGCRRFGGRSLPAGIGSPS
jgi:hypothetical protein